PAEPGDGRGEDRLRQGELVGEQLRRAGPAVVKHLRSRRPRTDAPQSRPDTEPLRILKGVDVAVEPHAAHFAAVPMAVRRDGVEIPTEVAGGQLKPLHSRIRTTRPA